jgi:hypothetical protein
MLIEYDSAVAQLATSAEDLTDVDGTFVETIYPEKMQARKHQIIYGRRGTGKTHLLRRVESRLQEKFAEGGILPIYVNGSQLSHEVSTTSSDPAMVALAIYVQLMQHIGAEIRRFVSQLNQASSWDRIVGGGKSQAARQADAIATVLEEALTRGKVQRLPSGEVLDEATTLAQNSESSSAGASIKVDPRNLGWVVKAGTAAGRSMKSSSLTTRKIRGEVILEFREVSSGLVRLLELLGKASIHVLFDEWSDVDKDQQVQPYLAEMLKKTASAVPGMYLKLACIPGRTFLATPITEDIRNPIGLEEGDDIHPDVSLDEITFGNESLDQLVPFFATMIKKHVGEKIEWVRLSSSVEFESFLASMIFSGGQPFIELCHASGGVSRDFINIYQAATTTAANIAKSGHRPPLDLAMVRAAAIGVYKTKRASFSRSASPQLRLLDRIYQDIYVKKNSYQFLLLEELAEDDIVQTLYMEKLIHRLHATYYDPVSERRYQYFQLDYGTTIDRMMANALQDARPSYENSIWTKIESFGGKFLGRAPAEAITSESDAIAAYTVLLTKEAARVHTNPREIIFDIRDRGISFG